jgi:hypothetical protein
MRNAEDFRKGELKAAVGLFAAVATMGPQVLVNRLSGLLIRAQRQQSGMPVYQELGNVPSLL